MENSLLKVHSSWSHIGGCSFLEFVQQNAADPDVFIKPHLNELVDEKRSILLSSELSSEDCELYVNIFPHYKIQAVSFVCNVVKVEIFHGHISEYIETVYGALVGEPDNEFKSYRYDVEIEKSGVTYLTLKFLTDSSDVCIFGLMLHTSPNPNGITTLLPNIPSLLKSSFKNLNDFQQNSLALDDNTKEKLIKANDSSATDTKTVEDMLNGLKAHIDDHFKETEIRINSFLELMEQRQNQKIDKILDILEKFNI